MKIKNKVEKYFVSNEMGRGQPACQEEWKMYRKKKRIVMLM
jgi:hypothetical protein